MTIKNNHILLPKFSHSSLIALEGSIQFSLIELRPIFFGKIVLRIWTLKKEISRMSHMSSSTDDHIWWWEFCGFKCRQDIFSSDLCHIFTGFCENTYCSSDLLLPTVSYGKYDCHSCACFCRLFCLLYIFDTLLRKKFSVSYYHNSYILFFGILCHIEDPCTQESKKICHFFRGSFSNIVIRKCPETHIWYSTFGAEEFDYLFCIVISSPVSLELWKSIFASPGTIPIHDESDMLHKFLNTKRYREYMRTGMKSNQKNRDLLFVRRWVQSYASNDVSSYRVALRLSVP
jgi:hypothetical protein